MRIYLAGKVEKNCWRHEIVKGLRKVEAEPGDWPILPGAVFGHDYVGPYFVSCDHGCYHGRSQHGMCGFDCVDRQYGRSEVVASCLAAIDKADLVYAWLPTPDAYGTIYELGFAHAKGKRIIIATPDRRRLADVWFAMQLPHVIECNRPEALPFMLGNYEDEGMTLEDVLDVVGDYADYAQYFKRSVLPAGVERQ